MRTFDIVMVDDWHGAYDHMGDLVFEHHDVWHEFIEWETEKGPVCIRSAKYAEELEEYVQEHGGFPKTWSEVKTIMDIKNDKY